MPSPVGHAIGGLIIAAAAAPRLDLRVPGFAPPQRAWLIFCLLAACIPDIDFAWGRHNMETHSITFAAMVGVLVLAWQHSPRMAMACALAAGTHVLFDWLGSDDSPPLGVMALWPFSSEFYFAEAYVFATISRRYWLAGFVVHNLMAVARELVILTPILAAVVVVRQRLFKR